jgi:hypothetical protein
MDGLDRYFEPPAVGSEVDTLLGSLERQRATFAWKCEGLDADQLSMRLRPSSLTLGRLLKHVAYMEDLNFTRDLTGAELPEPWAAQEATTRSQWVFESADGDAPATLYRLWDHATTRSRRAVRYLLAAADASATYTYAGGRQASVRRLLVDMIEEYGRHTGQADLIRESIDGRTGEDPPGRPRDFHLADQDPA